MTSVLVVLNSNISVATANEEIKMNDQKKPVITADMITADLMLRITSLENLLISKGLITQEELSTTSENVAKQVAKIVLQKANVPAKDIDGMIENMAKPPEDKSAN